MNTNIYYIPILDIENFSSKTEHVLKQKLISLGDIDNMTKFELTINDNTQEFEVYTQYTLDELFQEEYLPDAYIIDGDEEFAVERDFIPFIIFKPTDTQHSDFEKVLLIETVEAYRKAKDVYKK